MNNLLLVEDNALVRLATRSAIEDMNPRINIVEAVDIADAKDALANKGPFNLIISDYNYPTGIARPTDAGKPDLSMEGAPTLLRHLVSEGITTPVAVLSSNMQSETKVKLGVQGLLERVEAIGEKGGDPYKFFQPLLTKYFPVERPTVGGTVPLDTSKPG